MKFCILRRSSALAPGPTSFELSLDPRKDANRPTSHFDRTVTQFLVSSLLKGIMNFAQQSKLNLKTAYFPFLTLEVKYLCYSIYDPLFSAGINCLA
jgi:hypothetical protein